MLSKKLFILLTLTIALGATTAEAKNCSKGKPCGNACISKNDVCHKGVGTAGSDAAATDNSPSIAQKAESFVGRHLKGSQAKADAPTKAKHCSHGKPCGDSCIPKNKECRL